MQGLFTFRHPAIVTLFLLQTDAGPHQRREKLCGPHRKKFGDSCPSPFTPLGICQIDLKGDGGSVVSGVVLQPEDRWFDPRLR